MTEKRKFVLRIVVLALLAVLAVAMIVADVFAKKYNAIISNFLGVAEQIEGDETKINESAKSSDELVRKMADEGIVLLKNDEADGKPILPLSKDNAAVNLFGFGATDNGILLMGNGSGRSNPHPDTVVTLTQAFTECGISYNQEIIRAYEKHRKDQDKDWGINVDFANRSSTTIKEPVTSKVFTNSMIERAKEFSDTAVVVLSRYSGEFLGDKIQKQQLKYSLPTDTSREYNQITTEEQTLLKMCNENFKKVIVVFNTGSIMDLTFLEGIAPDGENIGAIPAALNAGYLGQSGAMAIPRILYGDVSPSAKLADTVVYNPRVNELTRFNSAVHTNEMDSRDDVYTENIYVGYKFYETADAVGYFADPNGYYANKMFGDKTGYDGVVQFPFGYGLSYTDFKWEVEDVNVANGGELKKDSEIEIKVKVTNTGSTAGKDVVQLYYTPQYYAGGIEKPSISLLDFAKTPTLEPNSSTTVTLKTTAYEMASYDCYDKNNNKYATWELDKGTYELKLMSDAHNGKSGMESDKNSTNGVITYSVKKDIIWTIDPVSQKEVKNRFTGADAYLNTPVDGSTLGQGIKFLSRSDWANTVKTSKYNVIRVSPNANYQTPYDGYDILYAAKPTTGVDAGLYLVTKEDGSKASASDFTNGSAQLKYNDELMFFLGQPENYDSEKWDMFLNQLSEDEIRTVCEDAGYGSKIAANIGKNKWVDQDGPSGFNTTNLSPDGKYKLTAFPTENLVAQTYNKELLFQMGQVIGIDAENFNMSGIYAPGVNLHKNSFGGRNYEYYSEDGVLSGKLAAEFSLGAKSNGTVVYVKHFATYDYQSWGSVWVTEQALREIYLRPFEIAVKQGGATGVMTTFHSLGSCWTGGNHALVNDILRDEWGFKGVVITDYQDGSTELMKMSLALRARAGMQLNPNVNNAGAYGRIDKSNPVEMNLARLVVKDVVYSKCNVYYAAKHNTIKNEFTVEISGPRAVKMGFRWWIIVVVVINVVTFGLLAWRATALTLALVRSHKQKSSATKPIGEPTERQLEKMAARRQRAVERAEKKKAKRAVICPVENTVGDDAENTVENNTVKDETIETDDKIETSIERSESENVETVKFDTQNGGAEYISQVGDDGELKSEIAALHSELAQIKEMLASIVNPQVKKSPSTKQQIGEMKDEINELKTLLRDIAENNGKRGKGK